MPRRPFAYQLDFKIWYVAAIAQRHLTFQKADHDNRSFQLFILWYFGNHLRALARFVSLQDNEQHFDMALDTHPYIKSMSKLRCDEKESRLEA